MKPKADNLLVARVLAMVVEKSIEVGFLEAAEFYETILVEYIRTVDAMPEPEPDGGNGTIH